MEINKTNLEGVMMIKPDVFQDERGFFTEPYSQKKLSSLGIEADWVLDCHSKSVKKGVLRGLHFQLPPHTQAKLVRVTRGSVYDVVVDLRKDSPTFGKWEGFTLTEKGFEMLFVPRGFAHGFCTLEDNTEFQYKCDNHYTPQSEAGIAWNDPTLNINWPITEPILSEKDAKAQLFKDFSSPF
jgi:dTDP-4-dehydrorhamnose 3,5-epimerase